MYLVSFYKNAKFSSLSLMTANYNVSQLSRCKNWSRFYLLVWKLLLKHSLQMFSKMTIVTQGKVARAPVYRLVLKDI